MDPPFRAVLHTNYAPTEDEAAQIRVFCSEPEREIVRIDVEVSRLEGLLENLKHERDKLREIIDPYHALLSPLRRLSPELLQHVFVCCLPSTRNPAMHHSEAPLLLGRVSKLWRAVVYGTAELWSSIHVVIPSSMTERDQAIRREATKAWLARSGACPLNISMYADSPPGEVVLFLEDIMPLSRQWRALELSLPMQLLHPFYRLVREDIPILHTFILRNIVAFTPAPDDPDAPNTDFTRGHWNALGSLLLSENLRHLSFVVYGMGTSIPLPLPSSQSYIEELFLDCDGTELFPQPSQCLDFLSECRGLRRCTIKFSVCSETAMTHDTPSRDIRSTITLEYLEHLSIVVSKSPPGDLLYPYLKEILDNLTVPALTELEIDHSYEGVSDPIPAFTSLVLRSSCALQTLSVYLLDRTNTSGDALIPLLLLSPDLTDLKLEKVMWGWPDQAIPGSSPGDALLIPMAEASPSSPVICPKLENLTLTHSVGSYISIAVLQRFLTSRVHPRPGCARLKSVDIRRSPPYTDYSDMSVPIPDSFLDDVAGWRDAGMSVSVPSQAPPLVHSSSPWLGLPDHIPPPFPPMTPLVPVF